AHTAPHPPRHVLQSRTGSSPSVIVIAPRLVCLTRNSPIISALGDATEYGLREVSVEASVVAELEVSRIAERLLDLCQSGRRRQRDRNGGQHHFTHSQSPPFSSRGLRL